MHFPSYDPAAQLLAAAAERTTETGRRLTAAAEAFTAAALDFLEEWEDEFDAGESFRRPTNFSEVRHLFTFEAREIVRRARAHRDLAFVLATEPFAAEEI